MDEDPYTTLASHIDRLTIEVVELTQAILELLAEMGMHR